MIKKSNSLPEKAIEKTIAIITEKLETYQKEKQKLEQQSEDLKKKHKENLEQTMAHLTAEERERYMLTYQSNYDEVYKQVYAKTMNEVLSTMPREKLNLKPNKPTQSHSLERKIVKKSRATKKF